ncbi:hypothetical protein VL20_2317 [Microcystis panniformis FACHB-1757]|uniref:Uncharacterized protein n=1 Tax=Microcystis panniformis FACHB-1757 TaxID=1638788 RepID=A0A0K1S037_9CHRO|nr:hypothetical protein VL20_2317 [Microcystis panniformis FACHB-1757]
MDPCLAIGYRLSVIEAGLWLGFNHSNFDSPPLTARAV